MSKSVLKILVMFCIIISILLSSISSFAIDNPDEEMGEEEFDNFLKTVGTDVKSEPSINSRHAVVYDRVTRKSFIWKKGK